MIMFFNIEMNKDMHAIEIAVAVDVSMCKWHNKEGSLWWLLYVAASTNFIIAGYYFFN